MTPIKYGSKGLSSMTSLILATSIAFFSLVAHSEDKPSSNLSRTAADALQIQTEISKDFYRQEPYEASYTVEVPYQEQETYYENVPYTERVPYTDYETYYENEYRCQNELRYRDECRDEQLCEPGAPRCRAVTECGTNALGQPICKTREVCEGGERQCRVVRQCRQVPYYDNVCRWEQVAHQRPVTRYREETRYRQELRTRTVTKYRTETRCCVTRYRDVFDHTETLPVVVRFPAGSELLAGETESFTINATSGNTLDAQLKINTSVFLYSIVSVTQEGRTKVFNLSAKPRLNSSNAGESTVNGLKISFSGALATVSFSDTVQAPRVQTNMHLTVQDLGNSNIVYDQELPAGQKTVQIGSLDRGGKYLVTLKVLRTGANVESGRLEFAVTANYEKKELDSAEVAALSDKSQVQATAVTGIGSSLKFKFEDKTFVTEDVQSSYKVVVWKKENGELTWLGEKTIARDSLQGNQNEVELKSLGIAASVLDQNLGLGKKVYFDIVVKRSSAKYLAGRPVQFISSRTFDITR